MFTTYLTKTQEEFNYEHNVNMVDMNILILEHELEQQNTINDLIMLEAIMNAKYAYAKASGHVDSLNETVGEFITNMLKRIVVLIYKLMSFIKRILVKIFRPGTIKLISKIVELENKIKEISTKHSIQPNIEISITNLCLSVSIT